MLLLTMLTSFIISGFTAGLVSLINLIDKVWKATSGQVLNQSQRIRDHYKEN